MEVAVKQQDKMYNYHKEKRTCWKRKEGLTDVGEGGFWPYNAL